MSSDPVPPAPPGPLATPPAWNLVADGYVAENVPLFTRFAEDALRLAALPAGARVVDVATGPGTLAFAAARTAARVDALDFAPDMIAQLEARAAREQVAHVFARVGDGQALPYPDASFDGAFSMFGLMFFPDRARGFAELRRVLVDGGRAVVSSWQPMSRTPHLEALMAALREQLPQLPAADGKGPLVDAGDAEREMRAGGFGRVSVHPITHANEWPDLAAFWSSVERATAPVVLLKHRLGAAWTPMAEKIQRRLEDRFGAGPQRAEMHAWLSVGTA